MTLSDFIPNLQSVIELSVLLFSGISFVIINYYTIKSALKEAHSDISTLKEKAKEQDQQIANLYSKEETNIIIDELKGRVSELAGRVNTIENSTTMLIKEIAVISADMRNMINKMDSLTKTLDHLVWRRLDKEQ